MTEQDKHNQYILAMFDAAFTGLRSCEEELNQYYLDEYREGDPNSKLREKRARSANPATVALAEINGVITKMKENLSP